MKIIIIGGGAAGFFSAIHNKESNPNCDVIIIEKSKQLLSKVAISGGGRCNVTHACFEPKRLCDHYPRGSKELRGPFHTFQPTDTMQWFESHGVPLKVESDNRVFPASNNSQSIIDCLLKKAQNLGIKIWTECTVSKIKKTEFNFELSFESGEIEICKKLVLATGSSRPGHSLAKSLGHTIIQPVPSLFTFKIHDHQLHKLSGLAIQHAEVWLEGKKKQSQTGPLLVTHWGMSGPSIIKLSAWNARNLHESKYQTTLIVNSLPSLKVYEITSKLTHFQQLNPKKLIINQSPFPEIPHRLWAYLVGRTKVTDDQCWNSLQSKKIESISQELSQGRYTITGKGQFKEEFVTCGGVSLKEINFKTMESTRCKGLHIIGELLDIDGITGGFNFQNAWTTGFISGLGIAGST
jgi:predicted Rossmann fold flavoprotein